MAEALSAAEQARRQVVTTTSSYAECQLASLDLNVWPAHDQQGQPAGYEARHAMSITCADVEQAGAIITALAESVGDRLQIEGVSLTVRDPAPALDQARESAFADAQRKATQLAGLAGVQVGEVLQIAEGGATPAPYGGGAELRAMKSDVGFVPGETAISASVTVTFSLLAD